MTKIGEMRVKKDEKGSKVIVDFDMFNKLVRLAPKVLKGRRGNNSNKVRIKKKLATEVMNIMLKEYIEENS